MYSVPVMNTKDKNVESPDYSGFSIRIGRILDVFGICSRPCCILLKNKTSLSDFPDYSGYSQGKALNSRRIFPIVPNIRNPLQDTAEILKYVS